jgi:serine protease inhibitor
MASSTQSEIVTVFLMFQQLQLLLDSGLKKLHETWKDETDCRKLWSYIALQYVDTKLSTMSNYISSVQKCFRCEREHTGQ